MKKIKNPFSYSVGHGLAGLTCVDCKYYEFNHDLKENNLKRRWCIFYKFSLNIMVGETGYLKGEFFCKNFDNKNAHEIGIEEFLTIKDKLEENILYEACQKEYLCMTSFEEIEKVSD